MYLDGGVEDFTVFGLWPGVRAQFKLDEKKFIDLGFKNIFFSQFSSGQNLYENASFDNLKFHLGLGIKQKDSKEVLLQMQHECLNIKSTNNVAKYSNFLVSLTLKKRF